MCTQSRISRIADVGCRQVDRLIVSVSGQLTKEARFKPTLQKLW